MGNVMVDTLLKHRERAQASPILNNLGLEKQGYAVLTLHRPSNCDKRAVLTGILDALEEIQKDLPIVLPMHPRLRKALGLLGLEERLAAMKRLKVTDPLGYLDFLKLMSEARVVLTDSGGIQEETTILRVPCLTLRENTERPVTVEVGSNRLVGMGRQGILQAFRDTSLSRRVTSQVPPLWDGKSADRIVAILRFWLRSCKLGLKMDLLLVLGKLGKTLCKPNMVYTTNRKHGLHGQCSYVGLSISPRGSMGNEWEFSGGRAKPDRRRTPTFTPVDATAQQG